jgi:exopolysaccharide production protein ExoQ
MRGSAEVEVPGSDRRRRPRTRRRYNEFGPWSVLLGQFYLVLALIVGFGVLGALEPPALLSVVVFPLAVGSALLAPRSAVRHLPISLAVLSLLTWMLISPLWAENSTASSFLLRQSVLLLIGVTLVAGLLPVTAITQALVWFVRAIVIITLVALLISPEARLHLDPTGVSPPYPGWHGFFIHKNSMAPVFAAGLVMILAFDGRRWTRQLTVAALAVLLVGSTSATGITAGLVGVSAWVWLGVYQRQGTRRSQVFVFSSFAVGVSALLGAIASLSTITEVYGRDMTFTGRTFIWSSSLSAAAERPVTGYGLGGIFWQADPSERTLQIWREVGFRAAHAHSGPLDLVLQLGLVGLILYLVVLGVALTAAWRLMRRGARVGRWICATTAVIFILGLSEPVLLGAWLGLVLLMLQLATRVSRRPDGVAHGLSWLPRGDPAERLGAELPSRSGARSVGGLQQEGGQSGRFDRAVVLPFDD